MNTKPSSLIGLFLFSLMIFGSINSFALSSNNILLERNFWKSKPNLALVKLKISEGHNPSELNQNAFDPVVYAILEKAALPVIEYLIQQEGNSPNKITHDGRSYIFWAAYKENVELIQFLLQNKCDTKIIDDKGYSVLNFAAASGVQNKEVYDLLIKNGANPRLEKTPKGETALHLIIPHLQNTAFINYFVNQGIDLSAVDHDGNGLFNHAAKGGNLKIMNWLIEQKVDFSKLNKNGENAFIFAARGLRSQSNTLETFQYLRKLGLDPGLISQNAHTCLIEYCQKPKDSEVVKYLIQFSKNINHRNSEGENAIILASRQGNIEVLQLLIEANANLNLSNKKGLTALANAFRSNRAEVVNFLINAGASLEMEDNQGNNLIYYWLKSYHPKDSVNFFNKQALLKKQQFDFSKAQTNESNFFHIAVESNYTRLVKLAIAMGADINKINKDGLSPLHLAAMRAQDLEILQLLIEHKADKSLKSNWGESAYDLALENEILKDSQASLTFLSN